MSKILLILTCDIQMINVIAIEPEIRGQNIPTIVYVCHLCLRSQYRVLLQKIPAAFDGK